MNISAEHKNRESLAARQLSELRASAVRGGDTEAAGAGKAAGKGPNCITSEGKSHIDTKHTSYKT